MDILDPLDLPELFGPGNAQDLRDLLCDSCAECTLKDCEHCKIIGRVLSKLDTPRLQAAGPGHVVCPKHGVQMPGHTCDWGSVVEYPEGD